MSVVDDFSFLQGQFENLERENLTETNNIMILIIDDDIIFGKTLQRYIQKKLNIDSEYFRLPSNCLEFFTNDQNRQDRKYCIITDLSFDDDRLDGLSLIDRLKEQGINFIPIVMTGFGSIESAINATKKGVFHYLTKPFELDIMVDLVNQVIYKNPFNNKVNNKDKNSKKTSSLFTKRLALEYPANDDMFCGMIGRSQRMKEVFERIKKVAHSDSTVLVTGESGTGKELIAKAIHKLSSRCKERMISINCGAIPNELLESELFGHMKGSFTGAISDRKGRFEVADKGTIFLDEIGDMPLILQVKILRVLQSREIEPIGLDRTLNIDVRIITATHRELETEIENGHFREDLFYRLNVIPIKLPRLTERREDIPLLISYFLSRFVSADGSNNIKFSERALELLLVHDWPGNVRELENLIERLVILKAGSTITEKDLPTKFLMGTSLNSHISSSLDLINIPQEGLNLKGMLSEIEDGLIIQALDKTNGNKNRASKLLHMNRTTLIEKMKKKGLVYS